MSVWSKDKPTRNGQYYWRGVHSDGSTWETVVEFTRPNLFDHHLGGENLRIPSPAELAAMEACVEALPIARKLLDDHLGIRETIEHAEKNPTDHWWQHDADQFRQIDAALAALDEAREESK